MKPKIEIIYRCPICQGIYENKAVALECLNSSDAALFKVGDIVEARYGFGWFNGDKKWVINPDVDTKPHGFGRDCSMGFYYVISHIDMSGHEVRYHLATKAMKEDSGYEKGFTFNRGHVTIRLISAPKAVEEQSKELIGIKSDGLI